SPVDIETAVTLMPTPSEGAAMSEYSGDAGVPKHSEGFFTKHIDFKASSVGDVTELNGVKGWTFEGYITAWDAIDEEGDATVKGCFDRTLTEHGMHVVQKQHAHTFG